MNSYRWLLVVICAAGLAVAACSSPEPAVEDQAVQMPGETQPAPATEPVVPEPASEPMEESSTGELQAVDLVAGTLTITDTEGNEQTFLFSESTEILGADGIQGLSGQEGDQVIVRHIERYGYREAASIEILPQ